VWIVSLVVAVVVVRHHDLENDYDLLRLNLMWRTIMVMDNNPQHITLALPLLAVEVYSLCLNNRNTNVSVTKNKE
jgi:hypothetical protein